MANRGGISPRHWPLSSFTPATNRYRQAILASGECMAPWDSFFGSNCRWCLHYEDRMVVVLMALSTTQKQRELCLLLLVVRLLFCYWRTSPVSENCAWKRMNRHTTGLVLRAPESYTDCDNKSHMDCQYFYETLGDQHCNTNDIADG